MLLLLLLLVEANSDDKSKSDDNKDTQRSTQNTPCRSIVVGKILGLEHPVLLEKGIFYKRTLSHSHLSSIHYFFIMPSSPTTPSTATTTNHHHLQLIIHNINSPSHSQSLFVLCQWQECIDYGWIS
jgi:hypothetical protein